MKKKIKFLNKYDDITDEDFIGPVEKSSRELLSALEKSDAEMKELYAIMSETKAPETLESEINTKLRSFRRASSNILRAYQRSAVISDELSARWKDIIRGRKRKFIPSPPANAVVDIAESHSNHFARGLNIYKLMLIFFIGSFAGVVIEMLWCLLTRGYVESRSGLVYGPFNMLYGAGSVALSVALYRFRNKGKWISFAGGAIVGSAVEYVCSWGQEVLFGSRSWDYSHLPFNINGRICLLYSVFWGFLGVLWVKWIYPWMAKLILKIPNRFGKVMTWLLMAFLALNGIITLIAVLRWSQRLDGLAPTNDFWRFIDSHFTDDRMSKIFANMEFS